MSFRSFRTAFLLVSLLACSGAAGCQKDGRPPGTPGAGGPGMSAVAIENLGAPAIRFSVKQEPPLGLTASDGTGLRLAALTSQAVVDGSLAFTELRLTFDNPESRVLEGRFRIALPPGASLQRFAMKIGGEWQESEVVELTAAREAYEDALHRKQDPALLENAAGNEFSARVFPIPANARKELIVSYVQELRDGSYVLPLRGLPEIAQLDARVSVLGARAEAPRLALSNDKPSNDYVVDVRSLAAAVDKTTAVRAGELVVARVKPQAESKPDPLAATVVLVDTSASRALGFEEELRTVATVVSRAAAARGQITVATFDNQVTMMFEGAAEKFGDADMAKLRAHGALGASNIQRALEWAGENAKKGGKKRVVLVTDGVATAGSNDAKRLTATVSALRQSGVERLDAVATGGIRDDAGLTKLVRNNLPHDGVVVQATEPVATIARRLDEATRSGVAVQIEGATWSWPQKLDGVQAGDEVSIYAEVPAGKPLKIGLDGKPAAAVESRATSRPLVERMVAQAQVASLLERELVTNQDLKKEITALAVRHRVLTPYTAMLVLETEQDYARFHIDRRTPPVVLAVEDGKIVPVARSIRGSAIAAGPIELADPAKTQPGRGAPPMKKPATTATTTPTGRSNNATAEKSADAKPKKEEPRDFGSALAGASGRPASPGGPSAAGGTSVNGRAGGGNAPQARAPRPSATMAPPVMSPPAEPAAAAPAPMRPRPEAAPKVASKPRPAPDSGGANRRSAEEGDRRALDALQSAQAETSLDEPSRRAPAAPPPPPRTERMERERDSSRFSESPSPRGGGGGGEGEGEGEDEGDRVPAYTGRFKEVMDRIAEKDTRGAFAAASDWRSEEPADVMALVALGEASEALGAFGLAARSYGSLVDLFPNRADLRRFAGERLERLADAGALDLAIDTYAKARADRPDHPASHRLLAFAYLRAKQPEKAFEVLAAAVAQRYPTGRFRGVDRILREDLGLAAAAWIRTDPKREDEIRRSLLAAGGAAEDGPSVRFVLVWETDANDVDFHVKDGHGNHAFYSHPRLSTGGELYADVTTGYGPECFTIRGAKGERAGPYTLQAHYYSRGPMGYGMGKLQIVEHDGKGGLTFEDRPFVVMNDHAFVDLGFAR